MYGIHFPWYPYQDIWQSFHASDFVVWILELKKAVADGPIFFTHLVNFLALFNSIFVVGIVFFVFIVSFSISVATIYVNLVMSFYLIYVFIKRFCIFGINFCGLSNHFKVLRVFCLRLILDFLSHRGKSHVSYLFLVQILNTICVFSLDQLITFLFRYFILNL